MYYWDVCVAMPLHGQGSSVLLGCVCSNALTRARIKCITGMYVCVCVAMPIQGQGSSVLLGCVCVMLCGIFNILYVVQYLSLFLFFPQRALASRLRDLEMFSAGVTQQILRRDEKMDLVNLHLHRGGHSDGCGLDTCRIFPTA